MRTTVLLMSLAPLVASCGGSSGPPQSLPQVSIAENVYAYTQSSAGPASAGMATIGIALYVTNPSTLAHPLNPKVIAQPGSAGYANASVILDGSNGLPTYATVTLRSAASLGPGVYTSSFSIELCIDPTCTAKLATTPDPLILTIQYTVT